jgi:hypothetical protein
VALALGRRRALLLQPPADLTDRAAVAPDPGEDLPHHARLVLDDLVRRLAAALAPADVAVAVGRAAQDVHRAAARRVELAAAAALEDLGPLVLGDHALHLQEEIVFWRAPQLAIEEDQLHTATLELVDQQDLIGVFAGQAIRRVDVKAIDGAVGCRIAQAFQSWAHQRTAAVTLVDETQLGIERQVIALETFFQRCDLTGDRACIGLLVGRDAGINRRTDGRGYVLHAESPP